MGTLTVTSTNSGAANTAQIAVEGGGNIYIWSGVVALTDADTFYNLGPIFNAIGLPATGPQALACLDMGGATLSDAGVAPVSATMVCDTVNNRLTFRDAADGQVNNWTLGAAPLAGLELAVIVAY